MSKSDSSFEMLFRGILFCWTNNLTSLISISPKILFTFTSFLISGKNEPPFPKLLFEFIDSLISLIKDVRDLFYCSKFIKFKANLLADFRPFPFGDVGEDRLSIDIEDIDLDL